MPRPVASVAPTAVGLVYEAGQALERQDQREAARHLYERALRDGSAELPADAAQLVRFIARTYLNDADYDAARDAANAALAISQQWDDVAGQGHAMNVLAVIEWKQGNLDLAAELYLRARPVARRAGQAQLSAMIASNLGVIAHVRGDEQAARTAYESSLADSRAAGLADQAIAALGNLGQLETQAGRHEIANRHLEEARELGTVIGDRTMLVMIELLVAKLRVQQGDAAGARAACERARALIHEIGDPRNAGDAEYVFGLVARASGDLAAAEAHFIRAEAIGVERKDMIIQGECARELADLYRIQGRNRQTLQRLNQAHRLFAKLRASRELADVDRRTAVLESDFLEVVRRWGESIESKDLYTQGHCERVADLACDLWMRAGGTAASLFWFRIGALLHDVGKLMVPAEVLNKPGALTPEEWDLVRGHPAAGVALLADIEFPWDVRPLVESHHERWDGAGYPHGLAGEAIPLMARVLCLADVYDALTSERSYKRAFTPSEALAIMRDDVGRQFDPALFREFEALLAERLAERPRLTLIT